VQQRVGYLSLSDGTERAVGRSYCRSRRQKTGAAYKRDKRLES
jgi:hypothetical protein